MRSLLLYLTGLLIASIIVYLFGCFVTLDFFYVTELKPSDRAAMILFTIILSVFTTLMVCTILEKDDAS
jgi:hypothetical protein